MVDTLAEDRKMQSYDNYDFYNYIHMRGGLTNISASKVALFFRCFLEA